MKKCLGISFFVISFLGLLLFSAFMYCYISELSNTNNRIIFTDSYYILQSDQDVYYQVCGENSSFDNKTITRISNFKSIDSCDSISACEISKDENVLQSIFGVLTKCNIKIEELKLNEKTKFYSRFDFCQYFAPTDIKLPDMSAEKIKAIVVVDSTDSSNVLKKITDYSDITNVLNDYSSFFTEIESEYDKMYDCYIVYKDCTLVEYISKDYLDSLQ